jgi:geranylgeranyl diphosphate synthase type I
VVELDAPLSLGPIGDQSAARIDQLLATESARWQRIDPGLVAPLESLRRFVAAGGKRLRPAFCHWGYVAAGGKCPNDRVVDAGAAIELVHAFALIHDDIMDGSARRRGQLCVHLDYADRHRRNGWRGDDRRFGDGAAILIGDLAYVYADHFLREAPAAAAAVFAELRLEVNIGQLLDLQGTATGNPTVEQARRICQYKSGRYTIERPLHLGAALAGALDELAKPLSAYGMPLGEAFQLRDDLLGAFGDSARLGKDVGEDLREGKPTVLYVLARQRAAGAAATVLEQRFGRRDLTDAEVAIIQDIYATTGAQAAVEEMVHERLDEALSALSDPAIGDEGREELRALALFVTGRQY